WFSRVATGSTPQTTQFTLPAGLPQGVYSLVVIANGIASSPVTFNTVPHLSISAPSTATAGSSFSITVTAQDLFNNTVANYTGTVHFTSPDGQASLPSNYTFVSGAHGVHTFTVTLKTAGSQVITATDTVNSAITGTSGTIAVSPAAATHLG